MDILKSSDYRDFEWAVKLNRFALELLGLWPKANENFKEKFQSAFRATSISTIIFFSCVSFVCALIRVWGDIVLMAENLQVTIPVMAMLLKFFTMRWKRTAILSIVHMIQEDWMTSKMDAEKNVMIRQARFARIMALCGYVFVTCGVLVVIIFPTFGIPIRHLTNLTDRNRFLPLQAYYNYDTDKSPLYEITFITQTITTLFGATAFVSVDSFLGLLVFHMCGQLENFRYRIANSVWNKDFDHALCKYINGHLRLIRFADNIEDIFTIALLGLILYFSIAICFYGFLLLSIIDNGIAKTSFAQMYFAIIGVSLFLSTTLLYCAAGELITHQCEAVYREICDVKWYELEYKRGRIFILLLIRANFPFRITAGKIIPLMMTTFCSLLKTLAGYISFLMAKRG